MRALMIPAFSVAMAVAPLALAQSGQTDTPQAQESQTQGGQMQGSQDQQAGVRSYDEIQSSLQQAGIENMQVLNAAYVVRAQTKDGEQVTLLVDPPATAAAAGQQQQQESGGQQAGAAAGQEKVRQALTDAGFQNIEIVEASYLAAGETKDGDQITMMIDASSPGGSAGGQTSPAQD